MPRGLAGVRKSYISVMKEELFRRGTVGKGGKEWATCPFWRGLMISF
jgi:hypothetical protein